MSSLLKFYYHFKLLFIKGSFMLQILTIRTLYRDDRNKYKFIVWGYLVLDEGILITIIDGP